MYLIGVDIGGTKISVCLGNEKGDIFDHHTFTTASVTTPEEGCKKITETLGHLLRDNNIEKIDVKAVGLAVPGPISYKEGKILTPPNLPGWVNVPIKEYFQKELEIPIFMNNDANAAVLAEWEFGSAKHVNHLIYLTMSTGIGGGIIVNGELIQGESDTAGEVGHFVLDLDGPECFCGQRGCFEAFCGGKRVATFLQQEIAEKKIDTTILQEANGKIEDIDMRALVRAAKKGDSYALNVWDRFIKRLAQAIGILLMTLNPDAIILGTIAVHAHSFLMEPLQKALSHFAWKGPLIHCRIEESKLKGKVGQLGALALAIKGLRDQGR